MLSEKNEDTGVLHNINQTLNRIVPITTPLSIAVGFIFPSVFIHILPFVMWLFAIITFSGALKLRAVELGNSVRSPLPILLFFITAHVLMPVIAMLTSSLFFDNPDLVSGFVLLFAGPVAVSSFIWIAIFKGDIALGLTLVLLDTILAPLVLPFTVSILMGAEITIDMTGIVVSMLFMIVIPTIIGITVNETSKGKIPDRICPSLDLVSKVCLMAVIATNASRVAHAINFTDPFVWKVLILSTVLTVCGFVLLKFAVVVGKCRPPKDITVIVSGGLRNNSVIMTIAVTFFPEIAVLPSLASIIFQQTIVAILGKVFTKNRPD